MKRKTPSISHRRLLELLEYDAATGIFTWRENRSSRAKKDNRAGWLNAFGYRQITVARQTYYAGPLAWFYVTKKWPLLEIDHQNRVRNDDRFTNLRTATRSQNCANRLYKSASGMKGVYEQKGLIYSKIKIDGKLVTLGKFDTKLEAHRAYKQAARRHFGEFYCVGT